VSVPKGHTSHALLGAHVAARGVEGDRAQARAQTGCARRGADPRAFTGGSWRIRCRASTSLLRRSEGTDASEVHPTGNGMLWSSSAGVATRWTIGTTLQAWTSTGTSRAARQRVLLALDSTAGGTYTPGIRWGSPADLMRGMLFDNSVAQARANRFHGYQVAGVIEGQ
jgi:hypothetical protein